MVISKKKPTAGTTVKDVDAVRCVCGSSSQFAALTRAADTQARRAGAQVAAVKKCACTRKPRRRGEAERPCPRQLVLRHLPPAPLRQPAVCARARICASLLPWLAWRRGTAAVRGVARR